MIIYTSRNVRQFVADALAAEGVRVRPQTPRSTGISNAFLGLEVSIDGTGIAGVAAAIAYFYRTYRSGSVRITRGDKSIEYSGLTPAAQRELIEKGDSMMFTNSED